MKWFWIPTVFYLVTQVKSWPTIGDVSTDTITITSIEKLDPEIKICFSEKVVEGDPYTLSVATTGGSINFETTGGTDTKCLTFPKNLVLFEATDYEFIVHNDNDPQTYAEGKITNCPKIPTYWIYTMVTDPLGNSNYLLRVKADGVENLELSDATQLNTEKDIAYYEIPNAPFTTKPCLKTQPGDILLCNDEITIVLTTADEVKVDSATLKLDVSEVNLQVVDALGADTFDIIVTKENGKINFCSKGPTELICAVDRKEHESGVFDIRVIGNKADKITATGRVTIHDRDLILSSIGEKILEGIWLHNHEDQDKKLYQIHLFDGTPTVDPVNVDCTNLVSTHCYGYILDVQTDTGHSMKVKPMVGTTANTTDENQNIYTPPPTPSQELAILSRHTKRHANQLMADVNICFEHLTPTEGRSFSHYEMLIINEKGQWLKHRILEEEEAREGRLCFTPFAINTRDFDLTEGTRVVVIQRGVDGFTVLATGQSKLL